MTFAPFSKEGEGPSGKLAKTLRARRHEHKPTGRHWRLGTAGYGLLKYLIRSTRLPLDW
jgi:hypothetical protein